MKNLEGVGWGRVCREWFWYGGEGRGREGGGVGGIENKYLHMIYISFINTFV